MAAQAQSVGVRAWSVAQGLIGAPFRLHGRNPVTGLDCVGLVAAAYHGAGHCGAAVPDRYRLRGEAEAQIFTWLAAAGFETADGAMHGDVALCWMGGGQHHLLLTSPGMSIHAHAGLRRVVAMPGDMPGQVIGRYRLRASG